MSQKTSITATEQLYQAPKSDAIILATAERTKQAAAAALPAKNMGQKIGNYGELS